MNCLYPGSFDPVTVGHMDVIRRASLLFDRVYVAILHNSSKAGCFTVAEREKMLTACCAQYPNVTVTSYAGLTVELAQKLQVRVLIRGVRNTADMEGEGVLARLNRRLWPEAETLLLPASPQVRDVSASAAREVAAFHGDLAGFVPPEAQMQVREKFGY